MVSSEWWISELIGRIAGLRTQRFQRDCSNSQARIASFW